jgi:hypothetical protein
VKAWGKFELLEVENELTLKLIKYHFCTVLVVVQFYVGSFLAGPPVVIQTWRY